MAKIEALADGRGVKIEIDKYQAIQINKSARGGFYLTTETATGYVDLDREGLRALVTAAQEILGEDAQEVIGVCVECGTRHVLIFCDACGR